VVVLAVVLMSFEIVSASTAREREREREREECLFSRKSKLPARADAMGFLDDAFALASFLSFFLLFS
jgi:hypothetical protein